MITRQDVVALHKRIIDKNKPIAVFIKWDSFGKPSLLTCKVATDLFRKGMTSKFFDLVGVYDERCMLEWLLEDIGPEVIS